MTEQAELLAKLHDIHTPVAPASHLSSLIISIVIGLSISIFFAFHYWQKKQQKNRVVRAILTQIQHLPANQIVFELACLLRQLVLMQQGPWINQLEGLAWQTQLDQHFNTTFFTQGDGQLFGRGLYQRQSLSDEQARALCQQIDQLIRCMKQTQGIKHNNNNSNSNSNSNNSKNSENNEKSRLINRQNNGNNKP